MKRLFKVGDIYFETREAAKEHLLKHGLTRAYIRRGPDHWRGETDGTSVQTPSSKKDPSEWKT